MPFVIEILSDWSEKELKWGPYTFVLLLGTLLKTLLTETVQLQVMYLVQMQGNI